MPREVPPEASDESDSRFSKPRRATQQAKARLARYTETSAVAAVHLARRMVDIGETSLGRLLGILSPSTTNELARRDRQRPGPRAAARWFTDHESTLVGVLATLIVPTDDSGPGAAQMLDQSAAVALDRLVAASPTRQALYARGLLDLDRLARNRFKAEFVQLPQEDQVVLLQLLDRLHRESSASRSLMARIGAKVSALYRKRTCPAAALFPTLVEDVLGAFYTNRVSWAWLGYQGPPMPVGTSEASS